jgi:P2-related tail formation protein
MFGLENKKNRKGDDFFFDLEVELKDPQRQVELYKMIEQRVLSIKNHLRSGENKDDFDRFGTLLHGYAALLKVIMRATSKPKK